MPRTIDGRTLYKFAEALAQADISRSTYKRWLKEQRISDVRFRDRNNARLFTEEELDALKAVSLKVVDTRQPRVQPLPFRAGKGAGPDTPD
jgi:hypothetical protein